MAREYYFPQILRKINISFLSLFKDIQVAKYNADGSIINMRQVPVVFSHKQKYISNIIKSDGKKHFNRYLPILAVIITGLERNVQNVRGGSLQPLTKYFNGAGELINELFGPVPYRITYELSILTQSLKECEIILEQILPAYNPDRTITIQEFSFLPDFTRDIKINLEGVDLNFIDEVDEGQLRRIEANLTFSTDINFYKPIYISDVIKNINLQIFDSTFTDAPSALMSTYTYTVSGADKDNFTVITDEWEAQ